MDQAQLRANFMPQIDLLPALGLVGILWYGGHQVLDGHLTVGDIVAANLYVLMLIWPLRMVGMLLGQLPRSAAAAGRINDVLVDRSRDRRRRRTREPLPDGPGEVRFERVTFGYGPGRRVLDGLDLVIPGGQAVALVGATASGKIDRRPPHPALLRHRRGPRPASTAPTCATRACATCAARSGSCSRTRSCSPTPCAPTSRSPIPKRRRKRSCAPRKLAGADDFVRELPEGYDTSSASTATRCRAVSGSASRSHVRCSPIPRILILDDATSSVDPSKEHEIRAALAEVMQGRTTIIIAHRPATIALADRVVLLDGGKVVADGTHERSARVDVAAYREVLARAELEPTRRRRTSTTTSCARRRRR